MAYVYTVLFGKQLTKTDVNLRRNCLELTEEDFLAFKNVLIPRDQELFEDTTYLYPLVVEDFPSSSKLWSFNCKKSVSGSEGGRFAGNWAKFVKDQNLKEGSWLFFVWNQDLYRMRVNTVSPNEELNEEEQILFDALDDIVEDSVVGHTGGTTDPGGAGLEGTADPEGTTGTTGTGGTAVGVQHQVCVRDFVPSALACLVKEPPEADIVKNFLLKTLHLRGREKKIDKFTLEEGVIPASFKVQMDEKCEHVKESLIADYGGSAIGRVVPMDSGFGWITLLKSYVKRTRDHSLADMPEMQQGIKLILNLCLSDGVYTSPSLLCADACCVIDRRMDIYGYPIEIQALFSFALTSAKFMLKDGPDNKEVLDKIIAKIKGLCYHTRTYYWLDFTQLNNVYRYKTEEYSHTALNKFNVSPESIPDWLFEFMPLRGGYFIGNVSPACMDFRWFLLGNCIAILSSLLTPQQASEIMDLIEERWDEIIEEMPLKITYPALESDEWKTITGYESKYTWWSYHNGGFWPVLLWLLGAACFKTRRPQMARNAINLVEKRLCKDGWSEYHTRTMYSEHHKQNPASHSMRTLL